MYSEMKKILNTNLINAYLIRGSGLILTFMLNIILARVYGPDVSGKYYTAYNFMTLAVSIIFLGFGYVIVHYLTPYYSNNDNTFLGNILLSLSIYTLLFTAMLVCTVIALFSKQLSQYLYGSDEYKKCILILCITIVPYILILTLSEIFKAIKKPNKSILATNVTINLIFILLLLYFKEQETIEWILVIFLIANIIALLLTIIINQHLFKETGIKIFSLKQSIVGIRNNKKECLSFQKENFTLAMVAISNVILSIFDTLVISSMLTSTDVAIYSVANKVISFGSVILTTINSLIGFQIADLSYKNDREGLSHILIKYTKIMMPLGLLYYIFASFFAFLIPFIFGSEYITSVHISMLLAWGQLITIVTGPCSYFAIMTGYAKKYLQIVIQSALISIAFNLILVKSMGIYGSVITNLMALSYKNIRTFVFTKKQMDVPLRMFFNRRNNYEP